MTPAPHTLAALLLTAHLAKAARGEPRPLSAAEWGRLSQWLADHALQPEALLEGDPASLIDGWLDKSVNAHRVAALLARGGAVALALERWERAGLWVMTSGDGDYPERLRRRLALEAPPVLFGCGERRLLGRGGLAVVGSRDAGPADTAFAAALGVQAAAEDRSIVSGGARGIDEAAMLAALEHNGTVVGVLADSLMRAVTAPRYRRHLMAGSLVLVSPFNPEAGFDVGNAMARNRYIYCLADAAVVVSASRERGGTWAGAVEALSRGWVSVWVRPSDDPQSGNAALVARGALAHAEGLSIAALSAPPRAVEAVAGQGELLRPGVAASAAAYSSAAAEPAPATTSGGFYALFLQRFATLAAGRPIAQEQLVAALDDVTKPQIAAWLKRGVAEGRIARRGRPVRYVWRGPSLFGDE
jgi:predicted Rossmann fold nucleotide-binding protein DprA/Smf involved in DNA uptake